MCLIFGHKITEIKFFQIDKESGVLGYVKHTYNPRNVYSRAGNLFIGAAPVIFGNAVILLLLFLLVRPAFDGVCAAVAEGVSGEGGAVAAGVFVAIGKSFASIFSPLNFARGLFWLFLPLAFCISLHVDLSPADVKCSLFGLIAFVILLAAFDFVCALVQSVSGLPALSAATGGILKAGVTLTCVMALSLIFSLVLLAVAGIVRLILKAVKSRKKNAGKTADAEENVDTRS